MAKFTALWNYQRKKTGEIVIAEEELQKMLDAAWDGDSWNTMPESYICRYFYTITVELQ